MPNTPITADDINNLKISVEDLAASVKSTKEEQAKQRRHTRWLAASVALDVILSIAIALGGYFIDRNQDEISQVQKVQQEATELNRTTQCILANMLLRFENASTNSPTISEEERQKRRDSYADIHNIHDRLSCPSS